MDGSPPFAGRSENGNRKRTHNANSLAQDMLCAQPVSDQAATVSRSRHTQTPLLHHEALSLIRQIEMYGLAGVGLWLTRAVIDAIQGCQILSIRAQAGGESGLGKLHALCQG